MEEHKTISCESHTLVQETHILKGGRSAFKLYLNCAMSVTLDEPSLWFPMCNPGGQYYPSQWFAQNVMVLK